MKILILGNSGQLANEFKKILDKGAQFVSKEEFNSIEFNLESFEFEYLINCFAYTNVDKAELDQEECFKLNEQLPFRLSQIAKQKKAKFIHISTDYVFDGNHSIPYTETEVVNPTSIYGKSKANGEKLILESNPEAIIIRTSWLHGEGQNNFITKIYNKLIKNEKVSVVYDQVGSLTLAYDLARNIADNLELLKLSSGVFHYSGSGATSWYDLAYYLAKLMNKGELVTPVTSDQFASKVKRPNYSVLNNEKAKIKLNFYQRHWMDAVNKLKGDFLL